MATLVRESGNALWKAHQQNSVAAMDRLIVEQTIFQQLSRFASASDNLDFTLLPSICVPSGKIFLDVSEHQEDHPPRHVTLADLAASTHAVLAGFTATQHLLGNHVFTWPDEASPTKATDRVKVTCAVVAYHCIQDGDEEPVESVTARLSWHADFETSADGPWRLSGLRIERTIPLDNAELYRKAKARLAAGKGRMAKGL